MFTSTKRQVLASQSVKVTRGLSRLGVETLERRDVPAWLAWTGDAGDSLWSNPANWVEFGSGIQRTPDASDLLIFGADGGTNTPSIDDIPSLTVADIETDNLFDQTVSIQGNLTVTGTITCYGTLDIMTGGILSSGPIYLNGGTLQIEPAPDNTTVILTTNLLDMTSGADLNFDDPYQVGGGTTNVEIDSLLMDLNTTWESVDQNIHLDGTVFTKGDVTVPGLDVTGDFTQAAGMLIPWQLTVEGPDGLQLAGDSQIRDEIVITTSTIQLIGNSTMTFITPVQNMVTFAANFDFESGTVSMPNTGTGLHITGDYKQNLGTLSITDFLGDEANPISQ